MATKIAFFDTKPYDRVWFDKTNTKYDIIYFENKLNSQTARLAEGCDAVCAFVNDDIDKKTIDTLYECGVRVLAMRSAGYSNIDFKAAYKKLTVVRVPDYSPYAVAEHAMALLQTLNRKTHKAYIRTRDFNFSLVGLSGMDLHGKTVGVIGTGKIGRAFIDICKGYGMKVLAYDLYPAKGLDVEYTDLNTLLSQSDIISLHCPLTESTYHILDETALNTVKPNAYIVNTSRGALIDSNALLSALQNHKLRGAALDVYEEEADYFFEDKSDTVSRDQLLAILISLPNVIITSHQAYLTDEALERIAEVTLNNLDDYFDNKPLKNEVCYQCDDGTVTENCNKKSNGRCF